MGIHDQSPLRQKLGCFCILGGNQGQVRRFESDGLRIVAFDMNKMDKQAPRTAQIILPTFRCIYTWLESTPVLLLLIPRYSPVSSHGDAGCGSGSPSCNAMYLVLFWQKHTQCLDLCDT